MPPGGRGGAASAAACKTISSPTSAPRGSFPLLCKFPRVPSLFVSAATVPWWSVTRSVRSMPSPRPSVAEDEVNAKEPLVYIASYGHRDVIRRHLRMAGWHVPSACVVTPGLFPDHSDGNGMKDDKVAMLQHIAALHPGVPLLLVDDSPANIKQARADGWAAIRVHRRRGIDTRCVAKITEHCAQQSTPTPVVVVDYDLTLTTRHVTSEVANPYLQRNGSLDGIENQLTVDMLVDPGILRALLPPSWKIDEPVSGPCPSLSPMSPISPSPSYDSKCGERRNPLSSLPDIRAGFT
jgi:hypothetical protein